MSIHSLVYELAKNNQFEELKEKVEKGADINMVIMGASDGKNKDICQWAFQNGACLLFSYTQSIQETATIVSKYSKNISMLKGPGEVSKGTFKKD